VTPPVFAHGQLRLYLLSILATQPMHGYELIQALGSQFGGTYIPSAGTIYPRLAKLEDEGLVTKSTDGRKTIYEITDAGRAELEARQGDLDGIESDITDSVRRLADDVRASVNEAMKTLRADLASAARDARADSRKPRPGTRTEPERQVAGLRLREAEMVLNEFRHQVRIDLRTRQARGDLGSDVVGTLKRQLETVRATLADTTVAGTQPPENNR
jgi:DNA-binding PadR family transcriptional regulator